MTDRAERLTSWLDARQPELLDFARRLIATPSPNPPGDERAVADIVSAELRALGITEIAELGAVSERPNLLARVGTPGHRKLILSGHLDTKPPGDLSAWSTDPFDPVIDNNQLKGLGSGDMKVAIASMVYAAAALSASEPSTGQLELVLSADEEAGSTFGAKWLAEHGHLNADAAIIGEPGGINDEWESISLVSRGALLFRVVVTGTQTHSSISDQLPVVNASYEMANLIEKMHVGLKDHLRYDPHPLCHQGPTVNVGVMVNGGVFYGVYPGQAEFGCDIRTLPGMSERELIDDIRSFIDGVRTARNDLEAELVVDAWVPATEISADHPAVKALSRSAEAILRRELPLRAFPGATDAPHFNAAGIPTVAACGPGLLSRAHSPNERLRVASVLEAAKIYALTADSYLSNHA